MTQIIYFSLGLLFWALAGYGYYSHTKSVIRRKQVADRMDWHMESGPEFESERQEREYYRRG